MPSPRQGTILILVAGICALMAALALVFLTRMRSDMNESNLVLQHAQAKIMLAAACNYVQETSRIGWDRYPSTLVDPITELNIHEEAFGWIDVRDGSVGPKNKAGVLLGSTDDGVWPTIGSHVRCPMHALKRPPFSTRMDVGFNLFETSNPGSPDYCFPLLKNPDPQPLPLDINKWSRSGGPGSVTSGGYDEFAQGEKTALVESAGKSWFRVFRDGPGTFIITCGAGGTLGYKDWVEVSANDKLNYFGNDPGLFTTLQSSEMRLHYRIEWTAAVTETTYHNLQHEIGQDTEHYETWPPNSGHTWSTNRRTQTWMKNPVGTIRWIQRLLQEPSFY